MENRETIQAQAVAIVCNLAQKAKSFVISKDDKISTIKNITDDIQFEHFVGIQRLGVCPDVGEDCIFGAIDIDLKDLSHEDKFILAKKLKDSFFYKYNLVTLIEKSKSKGFHLWLFFDGTFKRSLIQNILSDVIKAVTAYPIKNGSIEIFPKGSGGNGIFLPFFNSANVENENFWTTSFIEAIGKEDSIFLNYSAVVKNNTEELKKISSTFDFKKEEATKVVLEESEKGYSSMFITSLSKVNCRKGLDLLSGRQEVNGEHYTFKDNRDGTTQIYVNGKSTSCWLNVDGNIGSHDKGGPTLVQWLRYYNLSDKELEQIYKELFLSPKEGKSDNKIKADDIARYMLLNRNILLSDNSLFRYSEDLGIWVKYEEFEIKQEISGICEEFSCSTLSNFIKEVEEQLKIRSYIKPIYGENLLNMNKNIFVLNNVAFNCDNASSLPFDKTHYTTNKLSFNYEPEARCERWLQFMEEVLPENESRLLIQEMFGYCLTKDIKYHKAFFLLGEGRNGKSVLLNILQKLVGESNCSFVEYSDLNKEFGLASMHNKLINVANEISGIHIKETSKFKAIVGGDPVEINDKYEKKFSAKLFCKLVYAANSIPTSSDKTFGYFSKFIIIPFDQEFTDELGNQDKDLDSKLEQELSGIFNWAIEGLKRLREQGKFTSSTKAQEGLSNYEMESNNVLSFLKEECTINNEYKISAKDLYYNYRNYCISNGLKPYSSKTVGSTLKKLPYIEKKTVNNKVYYCGITLNISNPDDRKYFTNDVSKRMIMSILEKGEAND